MDFTKPIDITAVNDTAVKYQPELKGLHMLDAANVLKHFQIIPNIESSMVLHRIKNGTGSRKYDGEFSGGLTADKVIPRTIVVYPVVHEAKDEPERYRRSFIVDVANGLWDKKHPFEKWLIENEIKKASAELVPALFQAEYSADPADKGLLYSFDGIDSIISKEIAANNISVANKNLFVTGAITAANAGEVLLEMYRSRPLTFRNRMCKMVISHEIGDLYDDWYKAEHDRPIGKDVAGVQYLEGSNEKCELVRTSGIAAGSQRVRLTSANNFKFGTNKLTDLKNFKAFNSGNPYLFTGTMKYIAGTQIECIDASEFCVNDVHL